MDTKKLESITERLENPKSSLDSPASTVGSSSITPTSPFKFRVKYVESQFGFWIEKEK